MEGALEGKGRSREIGGPCLVLQSGQRTRGTEQMGKQHHSSLNHDRTEHLTIGRLEMVTNSPLLQSIQIKYCTFKFEFQMDRHLGV